MPLVAAFTRRRGRGAKVVPLVTSRTRPMATSKGRRLRNERLFLEVAGGARRGGVGRIPMRRVAIETLLDARSARPRLGAVLEPDRMAGVASLRFRAHFLVRLVTLEAVLLDMDFDGCVPPLLPRVTGKAARWVLKQAGGSTALAEVRRRKLRQVGEFVAPDAGPLLPVGSVEQGQLRVACVTHDRTRWGEHALPNAVTIDAGLTLEM